MKDVVVKYRAEFAGTKEDKEAAARALHDTWDGTKAYELIEPDVWSLHKGDGFSEDELMTIANRIIDVAPDMYFTLDIIHYDPETTAKHIKYRLRYCQHELAVYRDMI